MALEDWIDELCAIWEIDDGKGSQVRSYRVYNKNEFPEAITDVPCAISFTEGAQMEIQASGGTTRWFGVTEFHLSLNVDKSEYPDYIGYFSRIRAAAAAKTKLGGLVSEFALRPDIRPNVVGLVPLRYGSEEPHHGIVVYWTVKENETDIVGY